MFLFQFCFSGDTQKKNKSWEESNTLSGNTEHLEHMLATVEQKHCTDVLWEQDPRSR